MVGIVGLYCIRQSHILCTHAHVKYSNYGITKVLVVKTTKRKVIKENASECKKSLLVALILQTRHHCRVRGSLGRKYDTLAAGLHD